MLRKWKKEREKKSKLRTFNLIKHDWGESKFLKMEDVRAMHFLARVRSGTSELAIETERKYNVPPELRMCLACLRGAETEKHFLLECVCYEDVRRDLINKCGWSDLSDDDLLKRVCGAGVSDEQLSDINVFMR
jgi:hypothetical protein